MSDITEVLSQDAIAASLVAPIEHAPSANDETLADLSTDRGQFSREETQQLAERVSQPGERFENVRERETLEQVIEQPFGCEQEQSEAPQPSTPEQIRAGVQQLESFVQGHGLNDRVSNKELALDMAAALGDNASLYDSEKLGLTQSKAAESVWQIGEAIGWRQELIPQLPQVSPLAAREYTDDVLRSLGADPRMWDGKVNSQLLAQTSFLGNMSIAIAIRQNPGVTDVSRLTTSENAEFFYSNLLAAFGANPNQIRHENPAKFRTEALGLAYAMTRHMQSFMDKRGQLPQVQTRGGNQQTGGRRGGGRKPANARGFRTNADIFDNDALEWLELERAMPGSGSSYAGRERQPAQRFKTNSDIFDNETMEAFNGRL